MSGTCQAPYQALSISSILQVGWSWITLNWPGRTPTQVVARIYLSRSVTLYYLRSDLEHEKRFLVNRNPTLTSHKSIPTFSPPSVEGLSYLGFREDRSAEAGLGTFVTVTFSKVGKG